MEEVMPPMEGQKDFKDKMDMKRPKMSDIMWERKTHTFGNIKMDGRPTQGQDKERMSRVPKDMMMRRPIEFFPTVQQLIKMKEQEQIKNEAFILLINHVLTLFTEEVKTMEDVTQVAYKVLPQVEKYITEQMNKEQIDLLNIASPYELFNLVQSTGAGNFLSEEEKQKLWIEFNEQQMEDQRMMEDGKQMMGPEGPRRMPPTMEPMPEEFMNGSERQEFPLDFEQAPHTAGSEEDEDSSDDMTERSQARIERLKNLKERTRKAQRENTDKLLAKQDEREDQLMCMSRIASLENKEKQSKAMGIKDALTEEEKGVLSEYRKEYGISDTDEAEPTMEFSEDEGEDKEGEEVEEVGAEEEMPVEEETIEKFKPKKIKDEQRQEDIDEEKPEEDEMVGLSKCKANKK